MNKIRNAFLALTILSLVACSSTQEKKLEAQPAGETEIKEFKDAENAYRTKKTQIALKKFANFVQRHPSINLTNDAYFYLGQIYYEQSDYFRAARYWLAVVDSKTESKYFDRALIGAAQSESQIGHADDALKLLSRFKPDDHTDAILVDQSLELSAKLKVQKGDPVGAIQDLLAASDRKKNNSEKQALINRASEIVNGSLTVNQLQEISSSNQYRGLELQAAYRLATLQYEQKNWSSARDSFQAVTQKFPGTEQASRAQQYLNAIDAQGKTDATAIGVILPLSGKYSQMGYKTLRGIQMALALFHKDNASPFKLAIIDSEGNPDIARRGVERLVSEDHVIAIIGDLISKTAQAVSSKAQELGVPNLTLSQKNGLNDIGDFIFRSIPTPELQMKALVSLAMDQKGYRRFAIMYSNDSYGTEYASLFWDYVKLHGGEIVAVQTYQPEETDFRDPVQRLLGTYYGEEDRGAELKQRIAEWKKDQSAKGLHDKPPKDLLPPVVDFDALFIPDSPKTIGQLAPMLAYNDVSKLPLLGTNIWNTPQILTRGGKFIENALFIDDYFSEDQSSAMKSFTNEFITEFNYKPDVFEAHGYDSALLIARTLTAANFSASRVSLRDRLATADSIEGATGLIKMLPQRELEKTLIPLTVIKGQIVKLETGRPPHN
jgi:branched-chain amino acid transport system substrate-binding protein